MKRSVGILLLSAALFSCNKESSSPVAAKMDTSGGCTPEATLLKAGIVGGEKVSAFDVDAKKVMLLRAESKNKDGEYESSICTATAIAPNVLITAAHCIGTWNFVVFHHSLSCESGFTIKQHAVQARAAVIHKDWDVEETSVKNSAYDVAIVILNNPIPSSYRVMQIADPSKVDMANGDVRLIGYGVTDYKAGGSGILRKTSLPITKIEVDITKSLVGIDQSNGSGVCSGDSGGPSLVMHDNIEKILGVNSFVSGDKENGTVCKNMAVQSLAHSHLEWIKESAAKYGIKLTL